MSSRLSIARARLLALLGAVGAGLGATRLEAQRACRVTEITLQPANLQIRANSTVTFIATAYDASGSPCANLPTFRWTSSNPQVLVVDALGNAAALAPGAATLTVVTGVGARRKSAMVTATVVAAVAPTRPEPAPVTPAPAPAPHVEPPPAAAAPAPAPAVCSRRPSSGSGPVESIIIQPLNLRLVRGGEARQLEYRFVRADGADAACVPLQFLLDAAASRVVSVDSAGLVVSGNDTGRVTMRVQAANNSRINRQVNIQVTADSLRFARDQIALAPGATDTVAIEAPAQEHRRLRDLASMFQLTSSDTTRVRVTPRGVIEAVALGTAQIHAESPFYDLTQVVNVRVPGAIVAAPQAVRDLPTPRFRADSGRYLIETQIHRSQEATGQPPAEADLTERFYVSTTLKEQADSLELSVEVDSVAISGTPADLVRALRDSAAEALAGAPEHHGTYVLLTPRGLPLTRADTTDYAAVELDAWVVSGFLPALPPTTAAAGLIWSDTVTMSITSEGGTLNRTWRRGHRVAGWEDQGGVRALHITTELDLTGAGRGELGGQRVEFSETGHATVEHFLSAEGLRLGSTQSGSSTISQTFVARGATILVRSTTRVVVTRLP